MPHADATCRRWLACVRSRRRCGHRTATRSRRRRSRTWCGATPWSRRRCAGERGAHLPLRLAASLRRHRPAASHSLLGLGAQSWRVLASCTQSHPFGSSQRSALHGTWSALAPPPGIPLARRGRDAPRRTWTWAACACPPTAKSSSPSPTSRTRCAAARRGSAQTPVPHEHDSLVPWSWRRRADARQARGTAGPLCACVPHALTPLTRAACRASPRPQDPRWPADRLDPAHPLHPSKFNPSRWLEPPPRLNGQEGGVKPAAGTQAPWGIGTRICAGIVLAPAQVSGSPNALAVRRDAAALGLRSGGSCATPELDAVKVAVGFRGLHGVICFRA